MTLRSIVDRLIDPALPATFGAVAASAAFLVIGYGIAQPPEQGLASVIASAPAPTPAGSVDDTAVASIGHAAPSVAEQRPDPIGGPRACVPERGISEDCVFE